MSSSLGPILATGTITIVNQTVFNGKDMDWRIPIATGFAAVGFTALEKATGEFAVLLAWTSLIAVLFTRINNVPSPVESAVSWWNKTKG